MLKTEEYSPEFGELHLPDGFLQKLTGKTIDEQLEYYRITESRAVAKTAYGEVTSENKSSCCFGLDEYAGVRGLILRDGVVVGVRIDGWWHKNAVLLPYEGIVTYYASDNDGSGTNDREDCAYLICV